MVEYPLPGRAHSIKGCVLFGEEEEEKREEAGTDSGRIYLLFSIISYLKMNFTIKQENNSSVCIVVF